MEKQLTAIIEREGDSYVSPCRAGPEEPINPDPVSPQRAQANQPGWTIVF